MTTEMVNIMSIEQNFKDPFFPPNIPVLDKDFDFPYEEILASEAEHLILRDIKGLYWYSLYSNNFDELYQSFASQKGKNYE